MILLLGSVADSALALVRSASDSIERACLVVDVAGRDQPNVYLEGRDGEVSGALEVAGQSFSLDQFSGVYLRVGSGSQARDLIHTMNSDPARPSAFSLLMLWCELAPVRVVTRPSTGASNFSKPYQAQVIRTHGFTVPDTLITNDPALVRDFYRHHKRIVYKSISSRRSVVRELDTDAISRLDRILWCPTQFQQLVVGVDVRVHTINGECFAAAVQTEAVDYRYLSSGAPAVNMYEVELQEELADRCIQLADALALPFAGIDLKITPEGEVYCFEVNTSPAFSYYEDRTGQPISYALARYLAGASGAMLDSTGGRR